MTLLQNQQLNDDDLELLSAYIDNQLVAGERGALEERLRREPGLRTALEELRGTVAVLRELEPLRPPRSFTLDPAAFAPRPSPLFGWMRLGATLASVLLALTFAIDFVGRGGSLGGAGAPAAAAPTAAPQSSGGSAS
jgi:anti-sigma factor RsiW